jgi:hypothetical protein
MQVTAKDASNRKTLSAGAIPAIRVPDRQTASQPQSRLNISVIFTSVKGTMAALRTAGTLANRLGGRITLVVPEVVSYHVPLNQPPVQHEWNERRFRVLAAGTPVETTIRFYYCRDRDETLARVLKPHSLVVLGERRQWWPTAEGRLARTLRHLGHEVILTETE